MTEVIDMIKKNSSRSPVAEIRNATRPLLPPVGTVSLEGLRAPPRVEPATPSEDQVLAAYLELLRDAAPRRARADGEAIELGDDVELDLVAFDGDALVPCSFRHLWPTTLLPSTDWPGLFEALAGHKVGEVVNTQVTLPMTSAATALRGKRVTVTAVIHAAVAVEHDGPAEAQFARLELGQTFEATLEQVCVKVAEEQVELAEGARVEAVLADFAARWSGQVPDDLLEAELCDEWLHAEGEAMVEADVSAAVQSQALQQWLADDELRTKTSARLRLELALRALGEAQPPTLNAETVREELLPFAADMGFDEAQLDAALRADVATTTELTQAAFRLALVRTVLAKAEGFAEP